jgi:hypothetical protein
MSRRRATRGESYTASVSTRTEKPWLEVYGGRVEPETEFFEGSLYDLFRNSVEEHRAKTALTFYGTTFDFPRLQSGHAHRRAEEARSPRGLHAPRSR